MAERRGRARADRRRARGASRRNAPASRNTRAPRTARSAGWERLPDPELLGVRLCDLGLRLEETPLAARVERLHGELARAGLRFRPHVWLSTDWFSPSGVPGFAVPFFLAHPRLRRLERRQMFEVEGEFEAECLKLMRHETGHALDNGFRLRRRRRFRELFGSPAEPYRSTYVPRPSSRRFVLNLENWYAQSHPIEDFAETFAVWLDPRSRWRRRYARWPAARRKLEYVGALMAEIAERAPPVRSRERTDSLAKLRMTIGEYYRRKKAHYGSEDRSVHDPGLRRLFPAEGGGAPGRAAASFLAAHRRELRRAVSRCTAQYPFVVDQVLRDMILRCRDLRLRVAYPERETGEGAAALLALQTRRLLRRRHREYFR